MLKVRHILIDVAETGSKNTAFTPCFRNCCAVSYCGLNIVAFADTSCDKAKSILEILRVTYSVVDRARRQS